jgi:hypothetical protein
MTQVGRTCLPCIPKRGCFTVRFVVTFFFSKSAYLVKQVSDSNDDKSTMVLQTVLVMNMFSSPRTVLSVDKNALTPRTSSNESQGPKAVFTPIRTRRGRYDRASHHTDNNNTAHQITFIFAMA